MQEQMQQQFEQLQQGLTTAFDNGSQLAAPLVQANEVLLDSFKQLFEAQFEFGQACAEIGRKQIAAVADSNDFSALTDNQAAVDAWYVAITNYGDAVRKNAQDTHARMAPIGRDVTDTVVGFGADVMPEQFPVAAKPVAAKSAAADKQATGKTTRKAPEKAAARKAPTKATKKSPTKVAAKSAAKVAGKVPTPKVEVAQPSVPAKVQTKSAASTAPAKAKPAATAKAVAKSASNNDDKVDDQAPAKSV